MPALDYKASDTPKSDALLVAVILYIVIAAVPISAGAYYVSANDLSSDVLAVVVGSSLVLTWPVV